MDGVSRGKKMTAYRPWSVGQRGWVRTRLETAVEGKPAGIGRGAALSKASAMNFECLRAPLSQYGRHRLPFGVPAR